MIRLFYSPDISVSAGGELVSSDEEKKVADEASLSDEKKKSKKRYTPGADDNFKAVAQRTCNAWKSNPGITLVWTTQGEMQTLVKDYSTDLAERKSIGGDRPSITSTLTLLNLDMDTAVNNVKVYIEKKFKKENAKPQFPRYGIVMENGAYALPRDQNKRFENLDLMIAAIDKDGFGDEEYGTAFWTDMKTRFGTAIEEASSTDGTVSGKVSGKNVARKKLNKIMTALRKVLMGNYPDTYQAVLREWGWQK